MSSLPAAAPPWNLDELAAWRAVVESALRGFVDNHHDVDGTRPPVRLREAMAYALLGGGKRLRPLVCLSVASVLSEGGDDAIQLALPAAMALELVHTYSLVHDDLPALDDDDLRRGRLTVHKAFDEATAVLAGDGLLTDAFAILASASHHPARQMEELARAAGSAGMVGGQHDDMRNEGQASTSTSELLLREVHRRKTGRLFAAAAATGALAVDCIAVVDDARRYGQLLGFAFQVQDDVLDVEGDVEKGGKVRGRDQKHDKLTYVRALGLDGAKSLARQAGEEAVAAALVIGTQVQRDPALLVHLARFAAQRTH